MLTRMIVLFVGAMVLMSPSYGEVEPINTPSEVPVPKTTFSKLYTLHAQSAILTKINNHHYELLLKDVERVIGYSLPDQPQKNRLYRRQVVIKKWQHKKYKNVSANITGIQVNHRTIGYTQFYATVLLQNPRYGEFRDELLFRVDVQSPIIVKDYAVFENVTVFIDGHAFE